MRLIAFWRSHAGRARRAPGPARVPGVRIHRRRGGPRRADRNPGGAAPEARRSNRMARQCRPDHPEPRDVRLPAAFAVRRRPGRPGRHQRARAVRAPSDHPHDRGRDALNRSGPRRSRHGARDDTRPAVPPRRVAACAAVDRRRDPGGNRDRRRYGDDCGGGWRWRPRRVHLSRTVDGRADRHPGGRRSRGPPRTDLRRHADLDRTRDPSSDRIGRRATLACARVGGRRRSPGRGCRDVRGVATGTRCGARRLQELHRADSPRRARSRRRSRHRRV